MYCWLLLQIYRSDLILNNINNNNTENLHTYIILTNVTLALFTYFYCIY